MHEGKKLKDKWISALIHGDYKQGRGTLREGDCFCVLGVLCDIYDNEAWRQTADQDHEDSYLMDGSEWRGGLPPRISIVMHGSFPGQVVPWNDSEEFTFEQLGEIIAAYPDPKEWTDVTEQD